MADIFLSYKREDREKVRPLVDALQAQGWSVWWDTRIGSGETWDRVIESQLAAAKCVLVVWSKLSVDSEAVRVEAHEGRERKCLLPVTIESVKQPLAFRLLQATDLTNWAGDQTDVNFLHVCEGVRRISPEKELQNSATEVGSAGTYRKRGNDLYKQKDYDGAIISYTKAIEIDPNCAVLHNERGDAYFDMKVYDLSIADFAKAIEIDPNYALAYKNRGVVYHSGKNDYQRALVDLAKAIEIDPELIGAYMNRGHIRHKHKDYDGAIADYSKAAEIDPKFAAAYNSRGVTFCTVKNYDQAIADHSKAIELNPTFVVAYNNRALAYRYRKKAGDRERAAADFKKAKEL